MTREEAIKKLRQMTLPEETMEILEALAPELKESENESIRKALIKAFKEKVQKSFEWKDGIPNNAVLNWLEKQKERGPLTKEEEYILHRIIEYLEDEGCPQSWKDLLYDIYNLPYEKQKEQKPAEWSEEDSRIWNNIWDVLDGPFQLSEEGYKEAAQWFKTHCPYGRSQSQVEWSDEDEEMLDNIICVLQKDVTYTPPTRPNSCTCSGNAFYTHQTEIDWLEDLRPSWRPSEEQMEVLKEAVFYFGNSWVSHKQEVLESLYNDLKN